MTTGLPKTIYYIEGNVGAGKSTFLQKIHNYMLVNTFTETFDPLLIDAYYANPKQYAFHMQMDMMSRRIKTMLDFYFTPRKYRGDAVMIERSMLGDLVFMLAQNLNGWVDTITMATYIRNYHNWKSFVGCLNFEHGITEVIVHIQTTPTQCLKNICERARACEATITIEYLDMIEKLLTANLMLGGMPIVTMTWEELSSDFENCIARKFPSELFAVYKDPNSEYVQ